MFRKLRIALLLFILAAVGIGAWKVDARMASWERSINVAIYPIAADSSPATQRFIADLDAESFSDIEKWLEEEISHYGISLAEPVDIWMGKEVKTMPPAMPRNPSALDAILWSLKLRWWAWQNDEIEGPKPTVRLFVLFHDPEISPLLSHSTGLSKGKIAVVNAFASRLQRRQNAVIITHELLHTFGADDKYDLANNQPLFPEGYADPELQPLYPQYQAEIMGGRIPLSEGQSEIPANLSETVIGPRTAREIGLIKGGS